MQTESTEFFLARRALLKNFVAGKAEVDLDQAAHCVNSSRSTTSRLLRSIGWSVVARRHQFGESRVIYAPQRSAR